TPNSRWVSLHSTHPTWLARPTRAPILFFTRQPRAHPGWYPSHKSEKEPVVLKVPWRANRLGAEIKQRVGRAEADHGTDENTPLITRQQLVDARDDEQRKNTGHVADQEGDKEKRQSPVKPRPGQKLGKQHGDEDEPAQERPQENEERDPSHAAPLLAPDILPWTLSVTPD